jgi:predicted DCC family thiol-disulfide oxidoreductase YuxK
MAAGGVLFEATFILGILFRSPWIRLAFAAGAVSFLAGLYLFQGIQWEAWWILLVALLPWQPLAAGVRRLLPRSTVLIDGACPRCRRTARILHGLDWFDRLTFADATDDDERQRHAPSVGKEEALARMVAVDARGVVRSGFDAYRSLSRSVPLLAPLGLLAGLPWIRGRAERLYDAAASSRHRCSDETCTPGALPGQQRTLVSRAATLGALPCLLIVGVLVTQTFVSDRHLEREPFLSNYPMYSDTYASTAAYDASHPDFKDFRFFRYRSNTRVDALVSPENEVFPAGEAGVIPLVTNARRHALVRIVTKRLGDDDIGPKLRDEVALFTAGARTVSGQPASGEILVTANHYGFDWHRGRFGVKRADVALGVLDLRTLKLFGPV